ncbi:MAG: hypothetical protein SFV54_25110 [Bryobacteraceae bacterium]|nr:hypothetical protein [Bryobacteraceae bacterium]
MPFDRDGVLAYLCLVTRMIESDRVSDFFDDLWRRRSSIRSAQETPEASFHEDLQAVQLQHASRTVKLPARDCWRKTVRSYRKHPEWFDHGTAVNEKHLKRVPVDVRQCAIERKILQVTEQGTMLAFCGIILHGYDAKKRESWVGIADAPDVIRQFRDAAANATRPSFKALGFGARKRAELIRNGTTRAGAAAVPLPGSRNNPALVSFYIDGAILQHLGELFLHVSSRPEERRLSRASYRHCLIDLAVAVIHGGPLRATGQLPTNKDHLSPGDEFRRHFGYLFGGPLELASTVDHALENDVVRRAVRPELGKAQHSLRDHPASWHAFFLREAFQYFGTHPSTHHQTAQRPFIFGKTKPYLQDAELQAIIDEDFRHPICERIAHAFPDRHPDAIREWVERVTLTHLVVPHAASPLPEYIWRIPFVTRASITRCSVEGQDGEQYLLDQLDRMHLQLADLILERFPASIARNGRPSLIVSWLYDESNKQWLKGLREKLGDLDAARRARKFDECKKLLAAIDTEVQGISAGESIVRTNNSGPSLAHAAGHAEKDQSLSGWQGIYQLLPELLPERSSAAG